MKIFKVFFEKNARFSTEIKAENEDEALHKFNTSDYECEEIEEDCLDITVTTIMEIK